MSTKYKFIEPIANPKRKWPETELTSSPRFCAVDLRDGNQALPNPLNLEQKKEYFQLLLDIGFKEIEVGFPSASQEDFDFCRYLQEENKIPDDVMISVLAPLRKDLILRTMEALKGYKKARVHIYIATSTLHMKYVLGKEKEEILKLALDAVDTIQEQAKVQSETEFFLEFSPEEFTDSDLDFAVKICDAVAKRWQLSSDVILNLPATVERRIATHYADMIEVFIDKLTVDKSKVCISLHAHNDMGMAVAATQIALQAGGQRIEGTLFGHGERSGNVDLVTVILNLQYMGLDTKLDFSNLNKIKETVVRLTKMPVHDRHPYAGELVFSAFSGSHQDAIHKCLERSDKLQEDFGKWKIPYLHVDPADLGRSFDKFIRINSQSGKGGIAHIIELEYKIKLPRDFQVKLAKLVQNYAEKVKREISSEELKKLFDDNFRNVSSPLKVVNYWPNPSKSNPAIIEGKAELIYNGENKVLTSIGNGPIEAFVNIVKQLDFDFTLESFKEGAIGETSRAQAVSFVVIKSQEEESFFGVSCHDNIVQAPVYAICAAINNMLA